MMKFAKISKSSGRCVIRYNVTPLFYSYENSLKMYQQPSIQCVVYLYFQHRITLHHHISQYGFYSLFYKKNNTQTQLTPEINNNSHNHVASFPYTVICFVVSYHFICCLKQDKWQSRWMDCDSANLFRLICALGAFFPSNAPRATYYVLCSLPFLLFLRRRQSQRGLCFLCVLRFDAWHFLRTLINLFT